MLRYHRIVLHDLPGGFTPQLLLSAPPLLTFCSKLPTSRGVVIWISGCPISRKEWGGWRGCTARCIPAAGRRTRARSRSYSGDCGVGIRRSRKRGGRSLISDRNHKGLFWIITARRPRGVIKHAAVLKSYAKGLVEIAICFLFPLYLEKVFDSDRFIL